MPTVRSRSLALLGAAVAAAGLAGPSPASATIYPLGHSVSGAAPLTVGAIFPYGLGANHTCTGTVVANGAVPVVLTAAHCLTGSAVGWSFVPGYRNGAAPAGVWTVEAAYVDPRWNGGQNTAYDLAVLRLRTRNVNGHYRNVQYMTGATVLGGPPSVGTIAELAGYKIGRNDSPLLCSNRVSAMRPTAGYTSCSYLPSGVSGSGIRYGRSSAGYQYLGGVLGGYHQGGCAVQDAYFVPVQSWTRDLARKAATYAPASVLPGPLWDGCSTVRP